LDISLEPQFQPEMSIVISGLNWGSSSNNCQVYGRFVELVNRG
jgi:hypothetical protein